MHTCVFLCLPVLQAIQSSLNFNPLEDKCRNIENDYFILWYNNNLLVNLYKNKFKTVGNNRDYIIVKCFEINTKIAIDEFIYFVKRYQM
jgi:hypothetical protein